MLDIHYVTILQIYEVKELTRTVKVKFRKSFYDGKHDITGGFRKAQWQRIKAKMQYQETEILDDAAIEYLESMPQEIYMRRYEPKGLKVENYDTITGAIKTFGKEPQKMMAIEEMSELTKAICKEARVKLGTDEHRAVKANIVEEIADVFIMLSQLVEMYDYSGRGVETAIKEKTQKLEARIQKHKARFNEKEG